MKKLIGIGLPLLFFVQLNLSGFAQSGTITTLAGKGYAGYSGDGGPATAASLFNPSAVAVDSVGNLYIADSGNNCIRKVTVATGVISTIAGNGYFGFSGDGGLATAAQLASPTGVAVDSVGNLYIAEDGNQRIRKVTGVSASDVFFPQVVVGGGCSTLFTITNTGSSTASGSLILTDLNGNPFSVSGTLTNSSTLTQPLSGNSFSMTVPAGGTIFLPVTGLNADSPIKTGWAELESTGGLLTGVATYECVANSTILSMVGVLQAQLVQYATIPVDNDSSQDRQIAYAIANPSGQTIMVKLALVGLDGTVIDDTVTVRLGPRQQVAQYLYQAMARSDFKGSLVLRGQAGTSFVVIALSDKQGFLTVIPLVSGKAPEVPN